MCSTRLSCWLQLPPQPSRPHFPGVPAHFPHEAPSLDAKLYLWGKVPALGSAEASSLPAALTLLLKNAMPQIMQGIPDPPLPIPASLIHSE